VIDGPVYNGTFRNRGRRDDVILVGAPYYPYYSPYYAPYYDQLYYDPYRAPATIPGQLPGVYYPPEEPASVLYAPQVPADLAAPPIPAEPAVVYYPEPRIIITPPEPERVVEPPAIGATKADLLSRYGQPWGAFRVRGQEILSFTGGLSVVLQDGKVTEIR